MQAAALDLSWPKRCPKCGVVKLASDFYASKAEADGRDWRCKECVKLRPRSGATAVTYAKKLAQGQSAQGRAASNARNRRHRSRHPLRHAARRLLAQAVSAGRIEREACEVCGNGNTHGHHDDYARPLDVRWLCQRCHTQFHVGEAAAMAYLAGAMLGEA
jgi:transposase-like protein